MAEDRPRADLAAALVTRLRQRGFATQVSTGWEGFDCRVIGSRLWMGALITTAHPVGSVQVRVRRRVRPLAIAIAALAVLIGFVLAPSLGAAVLLGVIADALFGAWRTGPAIRRAITAPARA